MQLAEARPAPRLAGRESELARLSALLSDTIRQHGVQVAFVRGPAGVGCSALVEAFVASIGAGVGCVRAAAVRTGSASAYAPLGPSLAGLRARLEAPRTPVASLPALVPLEGGRADEEVTLHAMGEAYAALVTAAASSSPLVLVLEDLDAADASTQAVLGAALAALTAPGSLRLPEHLLAGLFVVASFRDDPMPEALDRWVGRTPAVSLPLAPLDLDGLRAYLDRGRIAERLLAVTGGIPARLEEVIAAPPAIDLAARRLERLAPADRDVLVALAVCGLPAASNDVAKVSGRKDAAARLARLADQRWVQARPGAGVTHWSLVRTADAEVMLAALPAEMRRSLALAAASAVEPIDPARATHLFLDGGDTASALTSGLVAADRLAERLRLEEASALLARVASIASPGARAVIEDRRARLAERAGDLRAALASIGRARRDTSEAGRPAFRARAARLVIGLGMPAVAERLARGVLATPDLPGPVRADATLALAEARFLRGAYEEVLAITEGGGSLAFANVRGKALLTLGRLDEARAAFEANALRARTEGDAAEESRALLNVGVVSHRAGDRAAARSAYERAIAAHEAGHAAIARANLSSLLLEEGRAVEALAEGVRAVAAFRACGRSKEQAHATSNLARIHLFLGDHTHAFEVAAHAGELASRIGDPYLQAHARLVLSEVEADNDPAGAHASLAAVADAFSKIKHPRYEAEALLGAAKAALRTNQLPLATRLLDRVEASSAAGSSAIAAEASLRRAELHLAANEPAAAAGAVSAARRALVAEPQLELPAELFFVAARVAEARGEPETARADRLEAVRVLEDLAARLPPERRSRFWSRPHRRSVLESVGVALRSEPLTRRAVESGPAATALVGRAPAIARVNALIDRIGPSMATVLVRGESGTGKELVARALHERSERRNLPLVAVNCGALNEELLLSELFGHEKGAFTGAIRERKGRFEQADGGTLFLDEVGDISPRAQVALLRALQEREFERVGGNRTIRVDVRVICATNRNLEDLMARGRFREDLYYRLRGATLSLPALRERPDDLPQLCEVLLDRQAREQGRTARRISPAAMRLLQRHLWPGNVRELQNVLESASLLATDEVLGPEAFELFPELFVPPAESRPEAAPVAIPEPPRPSSPAPVAGVLPVVESAPPAGDVDFYALLRRREVSLKDLRQELEFACISKALAEGAGNISEAARLLGMKRSRLSQIVNAEASLRALCRGGAVDESDDGSDDAGPEVADGGSR